MIMNASVVVPVIIIVLYFAALIYGAFFTKGAQMDDKGSIEEFAVGNRAMNWVVVMITMMGLLVTSSAMTSWFAWGVTDGLFTQYVTIYGALGFLFTFIFAKRIWIWGKHYNFLTQPDYIEKRYGSRALANIVGVAAIVIEAPWVIMEFAALGYMINAVTGLNKTISIIIVVVVVMAYVLYSGMKSLAVTEIIQGVLVFAVFIVGVIFMVHKLFGGFAPLYEGLMETAPQNLTISHNGDYSYAYWSSVIITGTLGIMGWASFFTRIYTAKSVREVKKVSWTCVILAVIVVSFPFILSLGGYNIPEALEAAVNENSFFIMAQMAGSPFFVGLCTITVLAAGMSLISVVVNSHSVIISENFVKPYRKDITSAQRVKIARYTIVIYSVVAMAIALLDLPNLYQIAIFAYDCIAQVVPLIVFSIYWKRSNKYAATIGFLGGIIFTLIGNIFGVFAWGGFTPSIFGLIVNIVLHVICGFAFKKDEGVDEMFSVLDKYEMVKK